MASYTRMVFESKGSDLVALEAPIPELKDGEILVKVEACGVCHSDVFTKNGAYGNAYPRTPGHEVIGVVEKVGPNAKRFSVGDRVGRGWHGSHCFSCDSCLRGRFVNCSSGSISGISNDGGYGTHMVAPWESLVKVPDGMSSEEAAPLLCAGVTMFNSLRNAGAKPPALVAVQGVGGLGHLGIQFAAKMGYKVSVGRMEREEGEEEGTGQRKEERLRGCFLSPCVGECMCVRGTACKGWELFVRRCDADHLLWFN